MKNFLIIPGLILLTILLHSCRKMEVDNTVKDIDGNIYSTVTIGEQVWMSENLRTTRYSNGDYIGTTSVSTLDISSETEPKYQWAYDGKEKNISSYGRLYTWYAIKDDRNICPTGWHIPSYNEWMTLSDYLTNNSYGFEGNGNDIAKSLAAQSGWVTVSTAGIAGNDLTSNNTSGFGALPGGYRQSNGTFYSFGMGGYWWSLNETSTMFASNRYIRFGGKSFNRGSNNKAFGFSVRCLRD